VNDMLPYLRLGHVTDPLEMETISFAEGPVCGVSTNTPWNMACMCAE